MSGPDQRLSAGAEGTASAIVSSRTVRGSSNASPNSSRNCYGCVLPLRSGAVRDLRTGTLTTAEPGDGVQVQTCVNAAAGPCHLDLPASP